MSVKIYITSTAMSSKILQNQNRIKLILDGKNIPYEEIDLSTDKTKTDEMRTLAGDPTLIPPQVFNGDKYCGDFQAIHDANEDNSLRKCLLLE